MAEALTAIGLMSGTSVDGVDAALVVTDGEGVERFGPWATMPYPPALKARVLSVLGGRGDVAGAAEAITRRHADAVESILEENDLTTGQIDVIGFHGQTILHRPEEGRTWQIGDGALLARLTGIDVVDDFRAADVAAGGEGAPLASLYHQALARTLERPLAVLNIGGVANVTWIGADDRLIAFDTGPGNALVDDWVRRWGGAEMDLGGAIAAQGRIDQDRLTAMLAHPYFDKPPPKSLDRNDFGGLSDDGLPDDGLALADGAATLTAFTAEAVRRALEHMAAPPGRWLVGGGGRHNATLMASLAERLGVSVDPVEAVGWRGDALEAEAFAFLAVRSLRGLALSLPSTTGVGEAMPGGVLHPAGG